MEPKIEVKRYKTRYWAVWKSDELIAVTLYKKGAEKVAWLLSNSPNKVSVEKQAIEEGQASSTAINTLNKRMPRKDCIKERSQT